MARSTTPKITWGNTYANTLAFSQPLDNATSAGEPREGSEWVQSAAGVEDAWDAGTDQILTGTARWIPTVDTGGVTGWDGAAGWNAFLAWARKKNVIRFYPDAGLTTYVESYLVEPMRGMPGLEENGDRQVFLRLRSTNGAAFTGY